MDKQKTILVVDDETDFLTYLATRMEYFGYNIVMAANAEEAVEKFKKYHPSLVITDYMLGPDNGLELASELKEISPDVPIICMSGAFILNGEFKIRGQVFDDLISKPIDWPSLKEKIENKIEVLANGSGGI